MSDALDQIPFGSSAGFADNPEPRCPCLLLLDVSGSMKGDPIRQLNDGLKIFQDELAADSLAAKRAEISIIAFGPVSLECDFQTADLVNAPALSANGDTPMGAAVEMAIDRISARKRDYKQNGITYYRPWIFMIADGAPTDAWRLGQCVTPPIHHGLAIPRPSGLKASALTAPACPLKVHCTSPVATSQTEIV